MQKVDSSEGINAESGSWTGRRITWVAPTSSYDSIPSSAPVADGFVDASHVLQLRLTLEEAPISSAARKDYIDRVQDVIATYPDIDAIHIIGNWSSFDEVQELDDSEPLWKALGGANPSHIALESTSDRKSSLAEIFASYPPWYRLQSFYLLAHPTREERRRQWPFSPSKDMCTRPSLYPGCFKNLENLSVKNLHFKGFYFNPEGGATALRSLAFAGDQATNALARTVFSNPEMPKTLHSLKLHCNGSKKKQARGGMTMIHLFLHECKALVKLDVVLNDSGPSHPPLDMATSATTSTPWPWSVLTRVPYYRKRVMASDSSPEPTSWPWNVLTMAGGPRRKYVPPYAGLYDSIPNTLTSLSFRGPPSSYMLDDLDMWIEKANNPRWLPNLKHTSFDLDLPNVLDDADWSQDLKEKLDDKLFTLLLVLGKRGHHMGVAGCHHIQQRLDSALNAHRS